MSPDDGIVEREVTKAMRRIGAYLEDEYDGPPGPQDDEGGDGIAEPIAELAAGVARLKGYRIGRAPDVQRIYTQAVTLVRRERAQENQP